MPDAIGFAEMLKKLRKMKGLSQDDLAKKSGVSKSAIAIYEAKCYDKLPNYKNLDKLVNALEIDKKKLLKFYK